MIARGGQDGAIGTQVKATSGRRRKSGLMTDTELVSRLDVALAVVVEA